MSRDKNEQPSIVCELVCSTVSSRFKKALGRSRFLMNCGFFNGEARRRYKKTIFCFIFLLFLVIHLHIFLLFSSSIFYCFLYFPSSSSPYELFSLSVGFLFFLLLLTLFFPLIHLFLLLIYQFLFIRLRLISIILPSLPIPPNVLTPTTLLRSGWL